MSRDFAFPGTRPRWAPDRIVDIRHLALVLDVDPASRSVAGTATLRVVVIAADTRAIEIDAVELTIERVTVGAAPARFGHDGRKLRVELPAAAAIGDELAIAIGYRGAPRRGLYFIAPEDAYPDKPVQVDRKSVV